MNSAKYKNWISVLGLTTCPDCRSMHGKIYSADEVIKPKPPMHFKCKCKIKWIKALYAGTATKKGNDGADWWLKWMGKLPGYYITKSEAKGMGFVPKLGNLAEVAPGKMLYKGEYENRNGHLPCAAGRVWYEADINFTSGFRGYERILFSNDGLVFVTYDHYNTFQVIV